MSMSLDGFVTGPDPTPKHPLGSAAAGERDVMLHGARTAQQCLRAGLLDEMEIHLIPVILGEGRPLFATLGPDHTELALVRALEAPGVLHLRYRVRGRSL
jgi:dihydrofolate reductase